MAATGKYALSAVGLTTVLSTELDGLASGSMSAAGATFDNSVNQDLKVDIEVFLASLSPTAGSYVSIYIAESVDGSNFPAPSAADMRSSVTHLLAVIPTGTAASTTQRLVIRGIDIPPTKMKFYLDNQVTVGLNASGNTVKILPYNYNLNG
jgi:hypothetical protein